MKKKTLEVIKKYIKRKGIENLVKFLEESDFFTAPASTIFHGAEEGGLAKHSFGVYENLRIKNAQYDLGYSEETIAISGLFHDLCKINYYKVGGEKPTEGQISYLKQLAGLEWSRYEKEGIDKNYASALINYYKNGGEKPKKELSWSIEDQIPLGHGEKSVYLIQKFIQLIDEEALAIRWHMVAFDPGIHFAYPSGHAFRKASEEYPLVTVLFTADYETSNIQKL